MRKAIVYASVHHGNTEKLVKGIAEECQVDLIDAVKQPDVDLSANYKSIEQILDEKRSKVIGKFGCKGYDTFGPFKLVGGIAKGHPDEEDIKNTVEFVKEL